MKDEEEVKQNWEKLKLKKEQVYFSRSSEKVCHRLLKAYQNSGKVKEIGFEFISAEDAWEKSR